MYQSYLYNILNNYLLLVYFIFNILVLCLSSCVSFYGKYRYGGGGG